MSDDVSQGGDPPADSVPAPPENRQPVQQAVPSAHDVAIALCAMVPFVQAVWIAIGGLTVAAALASSVDTDHRGPGERLSTLAGALAALLIFVLLARLSGPLLRACAGAVVLTERRVQAAAERDERLFQALERVAGALERAPSPLPLPAPIAPAATAAGEPHAEIRAAIRDGEWSRVDELIRALVGADPDDPAGARLTRERDEAMAAAAQALRSKLDAAREASDPARALELRDALVALLEPDSLQSLDKDMVRWLMGLIQKRLRAGTMRVDVAELAAMVAERFDHTVEGASLRASLPTLRRSAGLCARCGQPYTGIADACPTCLSTASFPAFGSTPGTDPDELDDETD